MDRQYYLDLAAAGLRMPIGTHLVLHEHADAEQILQDGKQLGQVVEDSAKRFRIPLALPLMDLTLEKEVLLTGLGLDSAKADTFHFTEPPGSNFKFQLSRRTTAACEAIRHIATNTRLLPVGMCIGPFSLMTKLIQDPITPVFLASTGATAKEEPEIELIERLLTIACDTIVAYLKAQITAGAKAVIVCEPAANKVYFSPNQLAESYETFDRFVMEPNHKIRELLGSQGVDLLFHDCGELVDGMVQRFATLDPAMLSLGSSRCLWKDAALLPKSIVLYGNLPTKQFYSEKLMPLERVRQLTDELLGRMRDAGHPFILGSECDVLSVAGQEKAIMAKVEAFLHQD